MSGLFDNPMGLMGFEFIEFAAPAGDVLEPLFEKMGITLVARHRSKDVVLYRRGDIHFIVNREPGGIADGVAAARGPTACGLAFRVKDAHKAHALALERGARPPTRPTALRLPAIEGVAGAPLYLVDRVEGGKSIYDLDFEFLPHVDRHPQGRGFEDIDRLAGNVCRGRMAFRGSFYERIFGFREIRFVDVDGATTGLTRLAVTAPDDVYDDLLEGRPQGRGEPFEEPARGVLLDGSTRRGQDRLLLQVFSEPMRGPAFLEFIRRNDDDSFGEGSFRAFFESRERDPMSPRHSRCFADLAAHGCCEGLESS